MIFIFDLDSTLLNTKKFFNSFAMILGISIKQLNDSSSKYFNNRQDKYSLFEHIEYLIYKGIISDENGNIMDQANKQIQNIDKYLFPDAEPLLKYLKSKKFNLILVTFGHKKWQQAKVDNLSIVKYFSRVIVTDVDKRKKLGFLKTTKDKICIINDKASETLALKEYFGKRAKVFLIKSHRSYDAEHDLKVYTLREVRKLIENEIK